MASQNNYLFLYTVYFKNNLVFIQLHAYSVSLQNECSTNFTQKIIYKSIFFCLTENSKKPQIINQCNN